MIDWLAVVLRFALYADLTLVFGVSAFALYSRPSAVRRASGRSFVGGRALLPLALMGIGLSLASLLQLAASMSGASITEVDAETMSLILSETSLGYSFLIRLGALLAAAIVLSRSRPIKQSQLILVATAAAIALGSLAWTGHGAMNEGRMGSIHLGANIAHLLAAGAWLGALLILFLLVWRARTGQSDSVRDAFDALAGFSWAGTVIVGLVLVSGLVNSLMIIGLQNLPSLADGLYGRLLLAKLLLFLFMLGLASANRFRLTPALEKAVAAEEPHALAALRMSIALEAGSAIIILALVAWLGMLEPPAPST